MSQPIIVCYRNTHNNRTVLIGSGDHLNLLVDSGYSDDASLSDKWVFGEIVVEDGPKAMRVIANGDDDSNINPNIRFKIEDLLWKQIEDTNSIIRHAKRHGFHPNLARMLLKEYKETIDNESDKILDGVRARKIKNPTEYRKVLQQEGLLLVEKWAKLFRCPENRIRVWRDLP